MADNSDFNKNVIKEFRENGGKVGGMFEGAPMLILTTTGSKSGLPREIPLVYFEDEGRIVIIASKGGAPTHPDWYHNLVANPTAKVEVGSETIQAQATITEGEERTRLFDKMVERMPGFGEYAKATTRVIPVVTLVPAV